MEKNKIAVLSLFVYLLSHCFFCIFQPFLRSGLFLHPLVALVDRTFADSVCRFVERRVERVEVAAVQSVLQYAQTFAESLVMNKLAFAQKFDRVAHVGIVREAENVIISGSSFLFWCDLVRTT